MRRVCLFLLIIIFTNTIYNSEIFKISSGPPDHPTVIITSSIIEEAYNRLGLKTKFNYTSWVRSLEIANSGESDAELCRKADINKKYPNLIMIEVPLTFIRMVIFSKQQELDITSWENLSDYRISYLRGIKRIEEKTIGFNVYPMNKLEDAFKLLENNRVDVVIVDYFNGLKTIKSMGLENIYALEDTLEKNPLYHYLHKNHENLLPKLEKILLDMTEDGTIDKITKKILDN